MNKKFPEIYAHRGFSGAAPENTLAAFKKAVELPIDGVEFDVQLTKDNKIVVIHDETLNRTTNGEGHIGDCAYDYIKTLDAGSWFGPQFTGEKVPLLEEVFEVLKESNCLIHIELKTAMIQYKGIEELVNNAIKKFKFEKRVIISSFNHYSVRRFRILNPRIKTAALVAALMYRPAYYLRRMGAQAVHESIGMISGDFVRYLKERGIPIRCYTVNTECEMHSMIDLQVSGVFTNYPDLMLKIKDSMT